MLNNNEQPGVNFFRLRYRGLNVKIDKIQDDGGKFILYGTSGLKEEIEEIFSKIGLGITVTGCKDGIANVLYTENNRDIVLRILDEHIETT